MLKPVNKNIILEKIKLSNNGIYIPDAVFEKYKVVSVSDGITDIKIGMTVYCNKIVKTIDYDFKTYYVCNYEDILAYECEEEINEC